MADEEVNQCAPQRRTAQSRLDEARADGLATNEAFDRLHQSVHGLDLLLGDSVAHAIRFVIATVQDRSHDTQRGYERAFELLADEHHATDQLHVGRILHLTQRNERFEALLRLAVADVDARCKRSRKELPAWLVEASHLVDPPF